MKKNNKLILISIIITLFTIFYYFDFSDYFSLTFLKENHLELIQQYNQRPIFFIGIYFIIYVIVTTLSIPGATILTLAGGSIFGLWLGVLIVSFASTIGATLSFLSSRYLLRNYFEEKFPTKMKEVNNGFEKDGVFYLLSLRLIPVIPFFLINILMGLTQIRTIIYFFISQVGMLLGTIVYINAGVQLSSITNVEDIFGFKIIVSFSLLGLLPLMAKFILKNIKTNQLYKNFERPVKYDYNMIVIGAGAGGLVTSYICAMARAKVLLIEKDKMGGDCLNTGCVPSKALINIANKVYEVRRSSQFGIHHKDLLVDFKQVKKSITEKIKLIEPHDSIERYQSLGVECLRGNAKIQNPWSVEIDGVSYTAKNITIATGASPIIPKIPGVEKIDYLTSDTIWNLDHCPERLLIVGAGPIGLELGQAFSRLGSKVTIIDKDSHILSKEDRDISDILLQKLHQENISIKLNSTINSFEGKNSVTINCEGIQETIEFDYCLMAIGRAANISDLTNLDFELNMSGTIKTNQYMQTSFPNIFACGDVAGPFQLTHAASHQAWYCAINALFGKFLKFKINYNTLSWVIYTSPEVATAGVNEKMAIEKNINYEVQEYELSDLDRAIIDEQNFGKIKVLLNKNTQKIIGATIVHPQASTLIQQYIQAITFNKDLNFILRPIQPYPTINEGNRYLAGNWKKQKGPQFLMGLLEKYNRYMR